MTVDERRRHELHERLDQVLDAGHADTLMALLPPVGWADVATNQDLDALEARMEAGFAELRAEIAGLRAEIAELRGEMRAEIAALRAEMHVEIAGLRGDLVDGLSQIRVELHRELRHQLWAILGVLLVALVVSEALGRIG